jgi:hydrogenase-4 component F
MSLTVYMLALLASLPSALVALVLSRLPRSAVLVCIVGVAGPLLAALAALGLAAQIMTHGPLSGGRHLLYADAFSALLLGIIALVSLIVMLYSIPYVLREYRQGHWRTAQIGWLYFWTGLLLTTMYGTVLCASLGTMWAFIEATTLVSAPLVGLTGSKASLEATWKYVMLATVGISFALLGTLILYASSVAKLGGGNNALDWTYLLQHAGQLDPGLVKLAFLFVLVGYGTKAGFAPLHTWLPDAHSQAPTPISALLSGALLNCAFYGIVRVFLIARGTLGTAYPAGLLILFGLVSIGFVIPFFLRQYDLKRLLAYSSVEHMGIMALAVGIGGQLGMYAAALHMVNHALAKTTLFCVTGEVVDRTGTRTIARITGLARRAPLVGAALLVGTLAIVGTPPFNVFVSEWLTFTAMLTQQQYLVASLFLAMLAVLFAAMLGRITPMVWGTPRRPEEVMLSLHAPSPIRHPPMAPALVSHAGVSAGSGHVLVASAPTLAPSLPDPAPPMVVAHMERPRSRVLDGLALGILVPACGALLLLGLWLPQWLGSWVQAASEVLR